MNSLVGTEKTSADGVREESPRGFFDGALTIDFLEGKLLGLSDEAEDHEPGDEIQASVKADWLRR